MKREIGSLAGLMAILAVAIHTTFPASQEGGGTSPASTKDKKGKGGGSSKDKSEPLDGPWVATQAFFNSGPSASYRLSAEVERSLLSAKALTGDAPESLRELLGMPEPSSSFEAWTMVATVADPVHTRFSLFFDDQIESIERAAAIQGWEFAGQWLPWHDGAASTPEGIEEQQKERRLERQQEVMPGVLIFRRGAEPRGVERPGVEPCKLEYCFPNQALFVFLVPETPTKGVAGDSFNVALNLASILGPGKKIGLLAPTYSGSFESLSRFVDAWHSQHQDTTDIYPTVYGGSISSCSYANAFQSRAKGFQFRSGIASSDDYKRAFRDVLVNYNINPDKAAYWIEDESGYAGSFEGELEKDKARAEKTKACPDNVDDKSIPRYTFPREISHLRNAYQEAIQGTRNSSRNAAPGLDISLKDPSHGEDSIPVYSDTHTPVTQSAAISTITEEFRREHTQIVFILASNTLDALLLARFVRNESPDTRVLIGDADILFIPAASQDSLAGTLFLSTYPMFILGQEWLTRDRVGNFQENGLHLVFPGANFQGIFNVTQLLLHDLGAPCTQRQLEPLYGYRPLMLTRDGQAPLEPQDIHPGLWLLSLTHYGFEPVDWLPAQRTKTENPWFNPNPNPAQPCSHQPCSFEDHDQFRLDPPSRGWFIAAFALSFLNLSGCFWYVKNAKLEGLGLREGDAMRLPALVGAGLSLSWAMWILALPVWHVLIREHLWPAAAVAALGLLAPLATLVAISYKSRVGRVPLLYACGTLALFGWLAVEWYRAGGKVGNADNTYDLLFRLRAGELFSGSSPLLPVFLLSLVFAAGFLLYFRRYTEAAIRRPSLRLDANPVLAERYKTINAFIRAPFEIHNPNRLWRLGTCIALVGFVMLIAGPGMSAFESADYNGALLTAIAVVLLALAAAIYDLVAIWSNLNAFLIELEKQPYPEKADFERVTEEWPPRRLAFWRLLPPTPRHRTDAEQICVFIVYAVRQTQRIAWSASLGLLTLIGVLSAYYAQAPQLVGRFVAVLFFVVGGIVIWVFAGMERNWILSRIARTQPGELNFEFWMQATAATALPFFGVLIHLFPSIGSFVSSWVAPSLEALR